MSTLFESKLVCCPSLVVPFKKLCIKDMRVRVREVVIAVSVFMLWISWSSLDLCVVLCDCCWLGVLHFALYSHLVCACLPCLFMISFWGDLVCLYRSRLSV